MTLVRRFTLSLTMFCDATRRTLTQYCCNEKREKRLRQTRDTDRHRYRTKKEHSRHPQIVAQKSASMRTSSSTPSLRAPESTTTPDLCVLPVARSVCGERGVWRWRVTLTALTRGSTAKHTGVGLITQLWALRAWPSTPTSPSRSKSTPVSFSSRLIALADACLTDANTRPRCRPVRAARPLCRAWILTTARRRRSASMTGRLCSCVIRLRVCA
jgi:hypothetical protein